MKHNTKVVEAFFRSYGIPTPGREVVFAPPRKWRFDYCWYSYKYVDTPDCPGDMERSGGLALEIEGGVWTGGRHITGAGFIRDMEKYNAAAALGWRVIRCTPEHLLKWETAELIRRCLCIGS